MVKILHLLLLFVFLCSSTGIVLGKHHCQRMQGQLLNGEVEVASCAEMGGCKKGCCTTDAKYFHLDQDQEITSIDLSQLTFPTIAFNILNQGVKNYLYNPKSLRFLIYHPPIVLRKVSVLYQVFLC